jgi:hypothetical protein
VNAGDFPSDSTFPKGFYRTEKGIVLGAVHSPLAGSTPRELQPYSEYLFAAGVRMGFLMDARKAGRVPKPPKLTPAERDAIALRLSILQTWPAKLPKHRRCTFHVEQLELSPKKGDVFLLGAGTDSLVVISSGDGDVLYNHDQGRVLKVLRDGFKLTVRNPSSPNLPFTFCDIDPSSTK